MLNLYVLTIYEECVFNFSKSVRFLQTLKDMDDATIKRMLGESNLPSWVNFPGTARMPGSGDCSRGEGVSSRECLNLITPFRRTGQGS